MLSLAEYYEEFHEAPRALELLRAAESTISKTLGKTHPQYKRLQRIKRWRWFRRVEPFLRGFLCAYWVLLWPIGARYLIGDLSLLDQPVLIEDPAREFVIRGSTLRPA